MSTRLAAYPLDPDLLDELALIADTETPLGIDLADRFRAACRADAAEHGGWIHPNHVTARLVADDPDVNRRRISALWATAEAPGGYLRKTDEWRQIDGSVSKGNGNKSVRLRFWVGGDAA
jgi:hypothetical protein